MHSKVGVKKVPVRVGGGANLKKFRNNWGRQIAGEQRIFSQVANVIIVCWIFQFEIPSVVSWFQKLFCFFHIFHLQMYMNTGQKLPRDCVKKKSYHWQTATVKLDTLKFVEFTLIWKIFLICICIVHVDYFTNIFISCHILKLIWNKSPLWNHFNLDAVCQSTRQTKSKKLKYVKCSARLNFKRGFLWYWKKPSDCCTMNSNTKLQCLRQVYQ